MSKTRAIPALIERSDGSFVAVENLTLGDIKADVAATEERMRPDRERLRQLRWLLGQQEHGQ